MNGESFRLVPYRSTTLWAFKFVQLDVWKTSFCKSNHIWYVVHAWVHYTLSQYCTSLMIIACAVGISYFSWTVQCSYPQSRNPQVNSLVYHIYKHVNTTHPLEDIPYHRIGLNNLLSSCRSWPQSHKQSHKITLHSSYNNTQWTSPWTYIGYIKPEVWNCTTVSLSVGTHYHSPETLDTLSTLSQYNCERWLDNMPLRYNEQWTVAKYLLQIVVDCDDKAGH